MQREGGGGREASGKKQRFMQVTVKSIEFEEETAIAIYFYDFSTQIESMKLQGEIIEQKAKNQSLKESHVAVSHEFRTPLTSSLMLLEGLVGQYEFDEKTLNFLWLIISQINLLLCLVNDSLDIQLIEQGLFEPKLEIFSPEDTFSFIISMFEPSLHLYKCTMSYRSVDYVPVDQDALVKRP